MARFKVGDRVKVRSSGRLGTVSAVFDAEYWNLWDHTGDSAHEYTVDFDDGSGAVNIVEKVLEFANVRTCECGAKFIPWYEKNHADYCPLYKKD